MSIHTELERNQVANGSIPSFLLTNSMILGKLVTQRRISLWNMYLLYTRFSRSITSTFVHLFKNENTATFQFLGEKIGISPWFHPSLALQSAAGSFASLSGRPVSFTGGEIHGFWYCGVDKKESRSMKRQDMGK